MPRRDARIFNRMMGKKILHGRIVFLSSAVPVLHPHHGYLVDVVSTVTALLPERAAALAAALAVNSEAGDREDGGIAQFIVRTLESYVCSWVFLDGGLIERVSTTLNN